MNDIFEKKYLEILLESEGNDENNKFKEKMVRSIKCEILSKNDAVNQYLEKNEIKKSFEDLKEKPLETVLKIIGTKLRGIESIAKPASNGNQTNNTANSEEKKETKVNKEKKFDRTITVNSQTPA